MLTQQNFLRTETGGIRPHTNSKARKTVEVPHAQIMADLARGLHDIGFFSRRFLGIEGHPGQIQWWDLCAQRAENGWSPAYLTTVVAAGNRAGKTLAMAILAFHHTFYKLGVRPPQERTEVAARAFMTAPYEWYHVAIQQEVAELLHHELAAIVRGEHLAQKGQGCPLTRELGPIVDLATKDRGEYLMLSIDPVYGGGRIHFRSAQDKAKALLGKDMNGISFDEAGVEPYLYTLYQEVLNLRRLSTGGPLHFIGTPTTGLNEYYDLWERGNPENPDRDPQFISLRLPTWQNVGFGLDETTYEAIKRQQDPLLARQNLGGEFIEAEGAYFGAHSVEATFVMDLPAEQQPVSGHKYSQGVDPALAQDPAWSIVIDRTTKTSMVGVRAVRKTDSKSLPAVINMAREADLLYRQDGAICSTSVDSTSLGGKMFMAELHGAIPSAHGFDFAGTKAQKLNLLADLKGVMDKGWLKLPRSGGYWGDVRRQLLSYKLDDKKLTQDAVMALAIAVRDALRNASGGGSREFTFF